MLKFPSINEGIAEHGYSNSCISEYIVCNIINTLGFPKIDMKQIYTIIDKTPFITDIRKAFYKKILNMRYEKILQYSYDKLLTHKNTSEEECY